MADSLDDGGKAKNDLNHFGEWVNALNGVLGTTSAEMAERIGVDRSALSIATHGASGMRPKTVVALIHAYSAVAEERGVPLPAIWEIHFSLSWFNDVEIESGASQTLAHLQYDAIRYERMSRLLAGMTREIERLARENETLKRNGSDTKKRF
jgi:hypothetical protein